MFNLVRLYLGLSLAIVLLAGCAATTLPIVMFPLPPEKPRLQWLGTFANENDFPKSSMQNFMASFAGSFPESIFKSPYGIASDSRGLIYVADALDQNLRVYDLINKKVEYYTKQPIFDLPYGVTVDHDDNLYVVDGKKKIVLVFTSDRKPLRTIGSPEDFSQPVFIKVDDERDRVYVSDSLASKIIVYNRAGKKLQEIGPQLGKDAYIFNPQGMAIDKDGNLFVAEMLAARISVLTPTGEFVRTFGVRGDAYSEFEAPKDLAFDSDGNLWVVDNRRSQFYTYTPQGKLLMVSGVSSRTDQSAIALNSPTSISIDSRDRILITDRTNRRFMVWQYRSSAYEAVHPLSAVEQAALDSAAKRKKELKEKGSKPAAEQNDEK